MERKQLGMSRFAHSKCKRYENRKIQGVALPKKERNGQEWKSSHHGTHHGEQDYGAVILQVVLHSIALNPRASRLEGKRYPFPIAEHESCSYRSHHHLQVGGNEQDLFLPFGESQQNLLLIDYQRIKYNKECNC